MTVNSGETGTEWIKRPTITQITTKAGLDSFLDGAKIGDELLIGNRIQFDATSNEQIAYGRLTIYENNTNETKMVGSTRMGGFFTSPAYQRIGVEVVYNKSAKTYTVLGITAMTNNTSTLTKTYSSIEYFVMVFKIEW